MFSLIRFVPIKGKACCFLRTEKESQSCLELHQEWKHIFVKMYVKFPFTGQRNVLEKSIKGKICERNPEGLAKYGRVARFVDEKTASFLALLVEKR